MEQNLSYAVQLRPDLEFSRQQQQGKTYLVVKDPLTKRYFRFTENQASILDLIREPLDAETVAERLGEKLGGTISASTIAAFFTSLEDKLLLDSAEGREKLASYKSRKVGDTEEGFLYWKLASLNPEKVFAWLLPRTRWAFTAWFQVFALLSIFTGFTLTFLHWDELGAGVQSLFNVQSLFFIWLVVFTIVTVHEFAHGVTCCHFGGKVHEVGLMLIYFQPAFYCDVSDSWMFPSKRNRMLVTLAGGYFQLVIWGLCTIVWRIPYPGNVVLGLLGIAVSWFLVNTVTLSIAVSFWSGQPFWSIWREGVALALLNFLGSAGAAGLIALFYRGAGFWVFLLSLPIAVVLYQLYVFYIERYEQARTHISDLNKLYLQTIEALASAVDAKDRYTHGHIRRVQAYAVELAKRAGIRDDQELLAVQAGALLHDIGKIAIPEYILNKPTVLTATEYEKMKIHPLVGATMLQSIEFPYPVVPIVKFHHERWDGNGYPERLKGKEIPVGARILSLVDCYDALTTNRPYRSPMLRPQIVHFFETEAGRAYDPELVRIFICNLGEIEAAGKTVPIPDIDVWGIKEVQAVELNNFRALERVQPITTYSRALQGGMQVQRELYSVFEFAKAELQCLNQTDVTSFMGSKLANLIPFDAAVFYIADLDHGTVRAEHVIGPFAAGIAGITLSLEQRLSGWAAANRQGLCNLQPFPDFIKCSEPRPTFELSAIAPMNRGGTVYGAISLYRIEKIKFTEEEFRRLELVASQTAITLSKLGRFHEDDSILFDPLTHVPNGFQLYLMFDQISMDAQRYEYPVALLSIHLEDLKSIRRRWGHMSGDEALRAIAKRLTAELRETDLLVRYASDEFVALSPRLTRDQAETLKSRIQDGLDHFQFAVRSQVNISLPSSIGISIYPDDGIDLETLLSAGEWRAREDFELRTAVKRRVRSVELDS